MNLAFLLALALLFSAAFIAAAVALVVLRGKRRKRERAMEDEPRQLDDERFRAK